MTLLPIMEASLKLLNDGKPVRMLLEGHRPGRSEDFTGPQSADIQTRALRLQCCRK